jgi:hypothetical protein
MKKDVLANRRPELEFFRAMLAHKTGERILILQAASSKGKTSLIRHFRRECPPDLCVVHLDFKGAEIGLAGVLHEFRELLGASVFSQFDAAYLRLLRVANVSDNTAGGSMDISIVLNVDEQTREFNLAQLNAAFFDDLRSACSNLVVIFDTFEKAPPDLQKWINGTFLPHVPRLAGLCVVIAGQSVPEMTSAPWEDICERRELGNIDDVDEWHTFARDAQLPHPRDAIRLAVLHCKGDPNAIVGMLSSTAAEWRR